MFANNGDATAPLRSAPSRGDPLPVFDHARFEPSADQANDPLIGNPVFENRSIHL
jgi:hypothetical protein